MCSQLNISLRPHILNLHLKSKLYMKTYTDPHIVTHANWSLFLFFEDSLWRNQARCWYGRKEISSGFPISIFSNRKILIIVISTYFHRQLFFTNRITPSKKMRQNVFAISFQRHYINLKICVWTFQLIKLTLTRLVNAQHEFCHPSLPVHWWL